MDVATSWAAHIDAICPGFGVTSPSLELLCCVPAGKSTLMGRLLHDLGYVSAKEAHRNLREAQQAGKVSAGGGGEGGGGEGGSQGNAMEAGAGPGRVEGLKRGLTAGSACRGRTRLSAGHGGGGGEGRVV